MIFISLNHACLRTPSIVKRVQGSFTSILDIKSFNESLVLFHYPPLNSSLCFTKAYSFLAFLSVNCFSLDYAKGMQPETMTKRITPKPKMSTGSEYGERFKSSGAM